MVGTGYSPQSELEDKIAELLLIAYELEGNERHHHDRPFAHT